MIFRDPSGRPFHVTLSSSSLAYAVSILPNGKTLDLQCGSSSSQKSRCAAIFGSPIISCTVEWVLRGAYRKTNAPTFMPSPFLRGKGDRLRWMRVDLTLLLSLPITRIVSPHLVAGKAPWQTARCACRLARCACRSSSQKVLRYFLGALFARARSLRGKPCIEPCSSPLLRSVQDPSTDARDDREGKNILSSIQNFG